jgi:hypothetical protein
MIHLLILLILVGVALYLIGLVPMDPVMMQVIRVVVLLAVLLYLASFFGYGPAGWRRV